MGVLSWFGRNLMRIFVYGGIFGFLGLIVLPGLLLSRMPETNARTRVSAAKNDLRSLATAIESYREQNGVYPPMRPLDGEQRVAGADRAKSGIEGITTWDADLGDMSWRDPFSPGADLTFGYFANGDGWALLSPGPDGVYNIHPERLAAITFEQGDPAWVNFRYDPTNGSFSAGDVIRLSEHAPPETQP